MVGNPDLSRRYKIIDDIAHREIEGQILLIRPDDNFLYTLNGTARYIWSQLKSSKTLQHILDGLVEQYGIEEKTAEADMLAFIKELEVKQVIAEKTKA